MTLLFDKKALTNLLSLQPKNLKINLIIGMNIVKEKSTDLVQELKIEIAKGDYAEKIESALKKQRQRAAVPGFRPGNAPMGMIRKMYYNALLAEEINRMVGEGLYGYLKEQKIDFMFELNELQECYGKNWKKAK